MPRQQPAPRPVKIEYEELEKFRLDHANPRIRRAVGDKNADQDELLAAMEDWNLEEIALSFIESGFWPQEALIAVKEKGKLVVVEGNRRLATLLELRNAKNGKATSKKWVALLELAASPEVFDKLFSAIPYIEMPDRPSVRSYLGYRHVTGIKEWEPAEKAEFISEMIESGLTYDEVRRRIGSKAPTVRQNYVAHRLLVQMGEDERIDVARIYDRFSVLYLSLRSSGVQNYLQVDVLTQPSRKLRPVPKDKAEHLAHFARWLFGTDRHEPVVSDSRQVDDFGEFLLVPKAVEYLERTAEPSFEIAKRLAGNSEKSVVTHIDAAAVEIQLALQAIHHHKLSPPVQQAIRALKVDAEQLFSFLSEFSSAPGREVT